MDQSASANFPLHLIPLLPLAGATMCIFLGRRLGRSAGVLGSLAVAAAMVIAWLAAYRLWSTDALSLRGAIFSGDWISASELNPAYSIRIGAGLLFDRLSATLTLVVTTVGFLIHVYSTAYMEEDPGLPRYFAYLNLFTGSMLILVLGDSLVITFVGWEGVGLCSYLLIGFWFDKEQNAYAGRKAFIVNRIGDFGFLLGMLLIFSVTSTLSYDELPGKVDELARAPFYLGMSSVTAAALLLFIGCTGKSAQLPLYVWLPDAMAGPTPVSALIHAATMVTAGVYLVARLHFLFDASAVALAVVASVGALTALFAATMGVAQRPIKKILAYSTISQLGFMFIGVGTRAYGAGVFHLVTHAFFKAGLFLGAGAIMHALAGEEDVMKMGGLRKKLPITHGTFLVYCLAIAGIFPFAGFFSKDAVLAGAFAFHGEGLPEWLGQAIYAVGLTASLMTAFYMFRAYFLVFHGEFRGNHHAWEHAHEAPREMSLPLVALAVGSVALGFLEAAPLGGPFAGWDVFSEWLKLPVAVHGADTPVDHALEYLLMGVALAVGGVGILVAWRLYGKGPSPVVERFVTSFPRLHKLVANKYYVDEIYDFLIVRPLRKLAWFLWKAVDAFLIDLVVVRGTAMVVDLVGRVLRYFQSGDVQRYLVGLMAGTAVILVTASMYLPYTASRFDVVVSGRRVTVRARGVSPKEPSPDIRYTVNFGEGRPFERPANEPLNLSHEYSAPGKKEITVTVTDPRWRSDWSKSRTVVIK